MYSTKSSKRYMLLGIIFSTFAILFALLYYFKVITNLDLYLAVTYVVYFVGLALFYNGAYNHEFSHNKTTFISFLVGGIFVITAIVLLISGFITGMVPLF